MTIPTMEEQRLSALLAEAAEPLDPVVSPGLELAHRAQHRLAGRRASFAVVAATVLTVVAGTGAWVGSHYLLSTGQETSPAGPDGTGEGALVRDEDGDLRRLDREPQDVPDVREPPRPPAEVSPAQLTKPGGHTYLSMQDYAMAVDWLWGRPTSGEQAWMQAEEVDVIEVVPVWQWPRVMADCLVDRGYPARVEEGLPWVEPGAQDADLSRAGQTCALAHQPQWAYADLDEETWREVHAYMETTWLTCLSQSVADPGTVIEEDRFVELALRGPIPGEVDLVSGDYPLASHCNPVPVHIRGSVG